eukprot:3983832-Prymnesium_polylepis.1
MNATLARGDRVECRRADSDAWEPGTIVKSPNDDHQLQILLDGSQQVVSISADLDVRKTWSQTLGCIVPVHSSSACGDGVADRGLGADPVDCLFADQPGSVHERWDLCITLDKDLYRPGDSLYARLVMLNAFTRRPLPTLNGLGGIEVRLEDAKGSRVCTLLVTKLVEDGVCGALLQIPQGASGGEYRLLAKAGRGSSKNVQLAPASRTFSVREFHKPSLSLSIQFVRQGYSAGDEVVAMVEARRVEGGELPPGTTVTAAARISGATGPFFSTQVEIGGDGQALLRFSLPDSMAARAVLSCSVEDGGAMEACRKTIPILHAALRVIGYPEGGELVAGLPSRLYLEATNPDGSPADVTVAVVDTDRPALPPLCTISTTHHGRGRAELTPPIDAQTLELRVVAPAGISNTHKLPPVIRPSSTRAVVLCMCKDVFDTAEPISVRLASAEPMDVTVVVSKIEKAVSTARIRLVAGTPHTLEMPLPAAVQGGVLRVTAFSGSLPCAERLTFYRCGRQLAVQLTTTSSDLTPGAKVAMTLRTTDAATGAPVPATVGVCVSDEGTRRLVDELRRAPGLEPALLLEREVRELGPSADYLQDNAASDLALDLLLGTQGWRRFAFAASPRQAITACGDAMRRVLCLTLSPSDLATRRQAPGRAPAREQVQTNETVQAAFETTAMTLAAFEFERYQMITYRRHRAQRKDDAFRRWEGALRRSRSDAVQGLPIMDAEVALRDLPYGSYTRKAKFVDQMLQALPGYNEALALVGKTVAERLKNQRSNRAAIKAQCRITFEQWLVFYLSLRAQFTRTRPVTLDDADAVLGAAVAQHGGASAEGSVLREHVPEVLRALCIAHGISFDVRLEEFVAIALPLGSEPARTAASFEDIRSCFSRLVEISFDSVEPRPSSISAVDSDVRASVLVPQAGEQPEGSRVAQRLQSAVLVDGVRRQQSEREAADVMSAAELPPAVLRVWQAAQQHDVVVWEKFCL